MRTESSLIRIVFLLIGLTGLSFVIFICSLSFLIVKGCNVAKNEGIKSVAQSIWDGTNKVDNYENNANR